MTDKSVSTPPFWQNRAFQVNILIFLGLFILSWIYFGFAFGPHPIDPGDTVLLLASSALGHYPACISAVNAINPYRPFVVTPICLSVSLFGPSVLALFLVGVLIYAILAFAWQGVVRSVFGVPAWLGFIIAVVFLAYPDVKLQTYGNCLTRMAGPALVLLGCWCVLHYWDHKKSIGWLLLGCLAALVGILTYESLWGAWLLGLPLALAYKERGESRRGSRRLSRRWLGLVTVVTAVSVGYLFWRLVLLPKTFTAQTLIAGGTSSLFLNPINVLRQFGQAYGLVFRLWGLYFPPPTSILTGADGLRIWLVIAAAIGAVLLALYLVIRRSPEPIQQSCVRSVFIGPRLFAAALISVPIMALPYLVTTIDAMGSGYITFGTGFPASLAIAALLVTSKQWKATLARVAVVTVLIVVVATLSAGSLNLSARVSPMCDFADQFTRQVPQLPPNYFVVVQTESSVSPGDWDFSTLMGYLYYQGPTGPDSYDLGRMGYQGYYFIRTPDPVVSSQGIQIKWGELINTGVLYRFQPIPEALPLSQTLLVEYHASGELTFVHVPDALKSLIGDPANGMSQAQAKAKLQPLCHWG